MQSTATNPSINVEIVELNQVDLLRGRLFKRLTELDEASLVVLDAHVDALVNARTPVAALQILATDLDSLAATCAKVGRSPSVPDGELEALLEAPLELRPGWVVAADVASLAEQASSELRRGLAACGYVVP